MPDNYRVDEWQPDEWRGEPFAMMRVPGFACNPDESGGVGDALGAPHERETDGLEDAWHEPGSDELMPLDVLAHVKAVAIQAELVRARRIARRGE